MHGSSGPPFNPIKSSVVGEHIEFLSSPSLSLFFFLLAILFIVLAYYIVCLGGFLEVRFSRLQVVVCVVQLFVLSL